jgi:tripeptide aminopeptidase
VRFILRDFDTPALARRAALLRGLAEGVVAEVPGASASMEIVEQYRNMREVLDRHPLVVERAREAMLRLGITPRERPIRGGTDGSRLSFMGLPTPNLFAGEQQFHSRLGWRWR